MSWSNVMTLMVTSWTDSVKHKAGHLAQIDSILDHMAMENPLKDPAWENIVGSMLGYRTDDLEQAKVALESGPYARCGIWETVEWSEFVLAAGALAGGMTW